MRASAAALILGTHVLYVDQSIDPAATLQQGQRLGNQLPQVRAGLLSKVDLVADAGRGTPEEGADRQQLPVVGDQRRTRLLARERQLL